MDDLISRQAAITALSHMCSEDEKGITVSRANVDSMLKSLLPEQPEEAIPVSWIEAKITQLISMDNEFAGLTVHIIKTLLNEWKAEQRSPEVDHDAQIREFAEEMSKHGVT